MKAVLISLSFLILCGCDFLGKKNDRIALYKMEQEQAERNRQERIQKTAAMRTYLEAKCKNIQEKLMGVTNELQTLKADAKNLETEISQIISASDKNGKKLNYEVRLLKMLQNKTINELAVKYLAEGFSLQSEEFIEKVRNALSEEKRFKEALKMSDEHMRAEFEGSKNWANMTQKQRESEVRRLEKEITNLEKKRQSTRRAILMSESDRREWQNKMRDYENEISKKRWQIDVLRSPYVLREVEASAARRAQDIQREAASNKESRDTQIYRRLKPKFSVIEIAEETNKNTIEKLRLEIKKKLDDKGSEEKALLKKAEVAHEILIAIPISEMSDLNRLKARADKEL